MHCIRQNTFGYMWLQYEIKKTIVLIWELPALRPVYKIAFSLFIIICPGLHGHHEHRSKLKIASFFPCRNCRYCAFLSLQQCPKSHQQTRIFLSESMRLCSCLHFFALIFVWRLRYLLAWALQIGPNKTSCSASQYTDQGITILDLLNAAFCTLEIKRFW